MTPDDLARKALQEAHEAHEHLLEAHANMDRGTLREPKDGGVLRDAFISPCERPHECWNRLEVAINRLARAAWEAGLDAGYTTTDGKGSWLPPKDR